MKCEYFEKQVCLSCSLLETSYDRQLINKMDELTQSLKLNDFSTVYEPVASSETFFRNKAKMVALGQTGSVSLGIHNHDKLPVELTDCPLYAKEMQLLLREITSWINMVRLSPYSIEKQTGELKFVLLTMNKKIEGLLRFVLRSELEVTKIKEHIATLLKNEAIKVCSVNIQPTHMAILEGEKEIYLTEQNLLKEELNGIPLYISGKTFFQTNTKIAEALYQTASRWVADLNIKRICDLFCGVGGFGLTCHSNSRALFFVEIFNEAVACIKKSANDMKIKNFEILHLDLLKNEMPENMQADLVILNPPRRGCGEKLLSQVNEKLRPKYILYSSCNHISLAKDLEALIKYQIKKVQLFDMFPHTKHFETLLLLERVSS